MDIYNQVRSVHKPKGYDGPWPLSDKYKAFKVVMKSIMEDPAHKYYYMHMDTISNEILKFKRGYQKSMSKWLYDEMDIYSNFIEKKIEEDLLRDGITELEQYCKNIDDLVYPCGYEWIRDLDKFNLESQCFCCEKHMGYTKHMIFHLELKEIHKKMEEDDERWEKVDKKLKLIAKSDEKPTDTEQCKRMRRLLLLRACQK